MKFKTIISIFLISTSILNAQETKTQTATFEYGLKAQNITYFPYETNSSLRQSQSNLKNNKDLVYLPFFKYRNASSKIGYEFSMIDVKLNNPYFKGVFLVQMLPQPLSPMGIFKDKSFDLIFSTIH